MLALLLLVCSATAADIIVFGDSWGEFAASNLEAAIKLRHPDHNVINSAVGGTTAEFWALNSEVLPNVVSLQPECLLGQCWVWLSIGGNDFLTRMINRVPVDDIAVKAVNDTATILQALFDRHPRTRVVMFGYDILNFEMSSACVQYGNLVYGLGVPTVEKNLLFYRIQAWLYELKAIFPVNLTILDLVGTLQDAGGIPNAPDFTKYSPPELMGNLEDCIHANSRGYDFIMDQMYAQYWQGEL
eukprot:TRINITY_DN126_c0_g1_i1.p1 TRINITY_DN126_c0_g1~~TRINITY_DN126_c0_g1_i1.p1  ORF type:complete len:277 (-),score=62.91 TRINITY_DN126_c0_g1_i1:480-1208(-)